MGKRQKRKHPAGANPPRESSTKAGGTDSSTYPNTDLRSQHGVRAWFRANWTDLRFLAVFAACMGVYYLGTLTAPIEHGFFPAYLRLNASASGAILRTFGEDVTTNNRTLISAGGPTIQIERGCDAIEPSALFVSAVLASPVPLLSRLSAALAGTFLLMVLNLIRVVSLFLVRVYFPNAFDTMHLDVWQALFIIMAIAFWAMWASRMSRKRAARADDST